MEDVSKRVADLYKATFFEAPSGVMLFPASGSERRYFRVSGEGQTVIATFGENVPENDAFIYFSAHFKEKDLPVPKILAVSSDKTIYLQEDFGDISLLNALEANGYTEDVYLLFKKSLQSLAQLQITGHNGLDYSRCLTNTVFGKEAIMADLLYFKYYFLDALRKPYNKQKLLADFEALSNYLAHTEHTFFMFRDFQSRNIILHNGVPHFIDYQGGMLGAPQYDVASLLWQAKANLSDDWKERLLVDYMNAFEVVSGKLLNREVFRAQYAGFVLLRLLQVLGAYGFRGLFERKAHFLTSIPAALRNLGEFLRSTPMGITLPEFNKALAICTSAQTIERFTPLQADENTPLVVKVCSFSYKKFAPIDETDNGGGFVFDCRGILNPGRVEYMKYKTGRDKEVIDFLEQQTKMPEFLNSIFDIVDIAVEEYIRRGFGSLMVSFGCTGGQHRSVYAADAMARHLKNKFKVKLSLQHLVQDEKNWKNEATIAN